MQPVWTWVCCEKSQTSWCKKQKKKDTTYPKSNDGALSETEHAILHNGHQPPEPPTQSTSTSTIQGAAVVVHLYWSRPAATEHSWQRVMPGRQLSKHCPVPESSRVGESSGIMEKSVQTAAFLCCQGGKAHTRREQKKPLCVCVSVELSKTMEMWMLGSLGLVCFSICCWVLMVVVMMLILCVCVCVLSNREATKSHAFDW